MGVINQSVKATIFSACVFGYWIAGPLTFILCVVDTWSTKWPVVGKLAFNLTFDAFAAAIWPVTWVVWMIEIAIGRPTPLNLLLGRMG